MKKILLAILVVTFAQSVFAATCNPFIKSAIQIKWNKNKYLGNPTTDFKYLKKDEGCFRHYKKGSIYATNAGGAWVIKGAIRSKWSHMGWENSFLGYPTTDETTTPDGVGRYNHFQHGSIYWHPCIGAHEVHGLIRNKWAQMGWEKGKLGYPLSDELKVGSGRYSKFQFGEIFWHPNHGTYYMSYRAAQLWWNNNGLTKYGYPVGDTVPFMNGDVFQKFSKKNISTRPNHGVDLRKEILRRNIVVRDQGPRPTCSVQSMNFLLEYGYNTQCGKNWNGLSVEYLNHMANVATNRRDDGDFFSNIHQGYVKYGVIRESTLPYDKNKTYNYSQSGVSSSMINSGKRMLGNNLKMIGKFVKPNDGTVGLTENQMKDIREYLYRGVPVAVGRSHSMVIVGYQYNSTVAGGGNFIFRNSYGTGNNGGYHTETFDHVKKTANDVFVYEVNKEL